MSVHGTESVSFSPVVTYKITPRISANFSGSISSNYDARLSFGMQYQISNSKLANISFASGHKGTDLTDTMIILTYVTNGWVIKVPVYTTNQGDNNYGLAMTLGICAAGNLASYWMLKRQ